MTKIITLTMSPAIDVEYLVTGLEEDKTNRARACTVKAGGKGINVSRCIKGLAAREGVVITEEQLTTVAVTGGETGILLKKIAESENLHIKTINAESRTRINTSVISDRGGTIEINSPSSNVGDNGKRVLRTVERFLKAEKTAGNESVVIMAGSLPADVDKDFYSRLVEIIKKYSGYAVLDCDGEALRKALGRSPLPDFIKPNIHELSGIAGRKLMSVDEVSEYASSLGDLCVITTLGEKGVVVTYGKGKVRKSSYVAVNPEKVCRLKGAGDTFLGAFVYHYFIVSGKKRIIPSIRYANRISSEFVSGRLSF